MCCRAGLLGAQIHVMDDELHLCDVSKVGAESSLDTKSKQMELDYGDENHDVVDDDCTPIEVTSSLRVQSNDNPLEEQTVGVESALSLVEPVNKQQQTLDVQPDSSENVQVVKPTPMSTNPEGGEAGGHNEVEKTALGPSGSENDGNDTDRSAGLPESTGKEKERKETRMPLCKCPGKCDYCCCH